MHSVQPITSIVGCRISPGCEDTRPGSRKRKSRLAEPWVIWGSCQPPVLAAARKDFTLPTFQAIDDFETEAIRKAGRIVKTADGYRLARP